MGVDDDFEEEDKRLRGPTLAVSVALLVFCVLIISGAFATTETRRVRTDTQNVNNLTGYKLSTSATSSATYVDCGGSNGVVYVGLKAYARHADGSETVLTGANVVGIASKSTTGQAQVTTTYAFPGATGLVATDSLVVRYYCHTDVNPPTNIVLTTTSEQLGAGSINASTWTLHYNINRGLYNRLWWGSATTYTDIANFIWEAPPSNTAPTVTLSGPTNASSTADHTPDFTFTATDTSATTSCTLWANVSGNYSAYGANATTANNTATTITANATIPAMASIPWYVNCTDGDGTPATGQSATWYLTVADSPTVTISSPAANAFTTDQTPDVEFSYVGSDATAACSLVIGGSFYGTNASTANNTVTVIAANDTLTYGAKSIYVSCAGVYTGNSSSQTLTIDEAPTVTLVSPGNATLGPDSASFVWYFTDPVQSTAVCKLTLDGVDYCSASLANNTNKTGCSVSSLPSGARYWNATCNDSGIGNGVSATWEYDSNTAPVVTITVPSDYQTAMDQTPPVTFDYEDAENSPIACTVWADSVAVGYDAAVANATSKTIDSNETLAWGIHHINVSCDDGVNTAWSNTVHYVIDLPPVVSMVTANGTMFTGVPVSLDYCVSDVWISTGTESCSIVIDGALECSQSVANASCETCTASPGDALSIGWSANCSDGYYEDVEYGTFDLDSPPIVTWVIPALDNSTVIAYGSPALLPNVSCSDVIGLVSAYVNVTGPLGAYYSEDFTIAGVWDAPLVLSNGSGDYVARIDCSDAVSTTTEYALARLNSPPVVTFTSPANGAEFADSFTVAYGLTDGDDPSSTCELVVDGAVVDSQSTTSGAQDSFAYACLVGRYAVSVTCNDSYDVGTSATRSFYCGIYAGGGQTQSSMTGSVVRATNTPSSSSLGTPGMPSSAYWDSCDTVVKQTPWPSSSGLCIARPASYSEMTYNESADKVQVYNALINAATCTDTEYIAPFVAIGGLTSFGPNMTFYQWSQAADGCTMLAGSDGRRITKKALFEIAFPADNPRAEHNSAIGVIRDVDSLITGSLERAYQSTHDVPIFGAVAPAFYVAKGAYTLGRDLIVTMLYVVYAMFILAAIWSAGSIASKLTGRTI